MKNLTWPNAITICIVSICVVICAYFLFQASNSELASHNEFILEKMHNQIWTA